VPLIKKWRMTAQLNYEAFVDKTYVGPAMAMK
jgi:hypothetical protein